MGHFPLLIPVVICFALSAVVFVLSLRLRAPGADPVRAILLCLTLYLQFQLIEQMAVTIEVKFAWELAQSVCLVVLPLSVTWFTLEYTGWKIRRVGLMSLVLVLVPLGIGLIYFSNFFQGWFRPALAALQIDPFVPLSYPYVLQDYLLFGYVYCFLIVNIILLVRYNLQQSQAYRPQLWLVIASLCFPLLGGIPTVADISILGGKDFTTYTFTLSSLMIALGVKRFSLFSLVPIARDIVMDKVAEAVIVVDPIDRMIDINHAAEALLSIEKEKALFKPLPPDLHHSLPSGTALPTGEQPVIILNTIQGPRHFQVNITPLMTSKGATIGRVLVFQDITRWKVAAEDLRQDKDLHLRNLEELYRFALEVADLSPQVDLVEFVANRLREITGAFFVAINEYVPETNTLHTRFVAAESYALAEAQHMLGRQLNHMAFPIDAEQYQMLTQDIIWFKSSLHEITFGAVPLLASNVIGKVFHLDAFIGFSIIYQGQLVATLVIGLQEGDSRPVERSLMAYTRIVAIALGRKKAESKGRASDYRFREMMDLLPQPVYECNLAGKFTFINRCAFELFGYQADEDFRGYSIYDHVSAEDRPLVEQMVRSNLAQGKTSSGNEYHARRRDGSLFPVIINSTPYYQEGVLAGMRGVVIDITQRKHDEEILRASEEKFRLTIEQLKDGFMLINSQGIIIEINQAYEQITSFQRREVIGRYVWDIQDELTLPHLRSQERRNQLKETTLTALSSGDSYMFKKRLEVQIWSKTRGELFIQQTVYPIFSENRIEIASVTRDITREKQDQFALERYARRMEIIHSIDQAILLAQSVQDIAQAALNGLVKILPVFSASFHVCDEIRGELTAIARASEENQNPCTRRSARLGKDRPPGTGQLVLINQEENSCAGCGNSGDHYVYLLPLTIQDKEVGQLEICGLEAVLTRPENKEVIREIGNQISIAVRQADLRRQMQRALVREQFLNEISRSVTHSLNLDEIIPSFIQLVGRMLNAGGVVVGLEENDTLLFPPTYAHPEYLGGKPLNQNRCAAWEIFSQRKASIVDDYPSCPYANPDWVAAGVKSLIGAPLGVSEKTLGVLLLLRFTGELPFDRRDLDLVSAIGMQVGQAIYNARLSQEKEAAAAEIEKAVDKLIQSLAIALELRDKETRDHSNRVVELSLELAEWMQMPAEDRIHFQRGVILHDMGKIGIPDHILYKPGKLTAEEWKIMRQHTVLARDWLLDIPYLAPAVDVPYYHHERWDGTGYPEGLKEEQIPLHPRMFAVVDVWDGITNARPYHPAQSAAEAADYIRSSAGTHFDPVVVDAFLAMMQQRGRIS